MSTGTAVPVPPTAPLHNHPAVDLATPAAAVVVQEREVVGLDPLLLDALVSAPRAGVVLQLVTPPGSRLTVALARAVRANRGQWLVRRDDTSCFDASTGAVLTWDGSAFTPGATPEIDPAWPTAEPTGQGSLSVDLTTVHAASVALVLGSTAETVCAVLTGGPPTGWGVAEPLSQPWEPAALTALCRDHAPDPTEVLVVGGTPDQPALGVLSSSRTTSGVSERLELQVGATGLELDRLDALAVALADLATPPRTAVLGLVPGRSDGTVAARASGGAVPYGLLLGPSVVAEVGRELARSVPAPAELVGPATSPSLWVHLLPVDGPDRADPAGTFNRVLQHLGVDPATA